MSEPASRSTAPRPPAGIRFVAVLAWIVGGLHVFSGISLLLGDEAAKVWLASLDFFVGAVAIVTGLTMLTRDRLGRVVVAVVLVGVLAAALLNVLSIGPGFAWGSSIAGAALAVIGLVLLFSRRANEYYR